MRIRIVAVVAAMLLTLLGIPHASADDPPPTTRTLTAHVTVNGVVEPGSGVAAWPTSVLGSQRNGTNGTFGEVDAAGNVTITLDAAVDYIVYDTAENITKFFPFNFVVFSGSGEFGYVVADTANLSGSHDFSLTGRTYTGQVKRVGFETFGFHTAGVGACPNPPLVPPTRPDGYCNGLRFTWADANGNYRLRLGPNVHGTATSDSWFVAGFLFIDGRPVVGPAINPVVPGGFSSESRDFSLDVNATPAPSAPASPEVSVASAGGVLNVTSVPVSVTPVPPDVTFANGIISFTAQVAQGGDVDVTLTFSTDVPLSAQWYKLRNGTWVPYANVTHFPNNLRQIVITLTDGDPAEDDDGIPNGYVTDPGALGVPTNQPVSKDQCKKDGWKNGPYKNQGECVSHFARK